MPPLLLVRLLEALVGCGFDDGSGSVEEEKVIGDEEGGEIDDGAVEFSIVFCFRFGWVRRETGVWGEL